MTGLEKIINRIQEEADAAAAGKPSINSVELQKRGSRPDTCRDEDCL